MRRQVLESASQAIRNRREISALQLIQDVFVQSPMEAMALADSRDDSAGVALAFIICLPICLGARKGLRPNDAGRVHQLEEGIWIQETKLTHRDDALRH